MIPLTEAGEKLRDEAICVPETVAREFHLEPAEAAALYGILYKILDGERAAGREG